MGRHQYLTDYVRAKASEVINDKLSAGIVPAMCSLSDLQRAFEADAVEAMRELIKTREFKGHITINKVPLLEKL